MTASRGTRVPTLVAAALVLSSCTGGSDTAAPDAAPRTTQSASEPGCGTVQRGSLPEWAREGFSPGDQAVPHVIGDAGDIVGVLFGDPLTYPPRADANNKILWVVRPGTRGGPTAPTDGALAIRATLDGSGTTAERVVAGGPGPSTIDLPAAGCWTFAMDWSGHHDTVHLAYTAG